MDVVGSEIGQKMRSAIKAKLTELGCYVDDELPDYVMVMVANKRTRTQMEDDLQLFLGDNTTLFVNWLHQVLKKLQEVTVTTPLKATEREKSKERSLSKEKKAKEKKEKVKVKKSEGAKKAKKKEKEKSHKKKEEKKAHKSKKKSKHNEMIRPNIPPLLMNMEKESEPSITDVFAGQILKSHGISLEVLKEEPKKPEIKETKRPILPIIDPATISSQPEPDLASQNIDSSSTDTQENVKRSSVSSVGAPREEQLKEINEIEAKIQGLKQKLAEQLDSMSEDEDFLNIRTEAEELMNDFAEDVFQEISQQAPVSTPPLQIHKSPSPPKQIVKPIETSISKAIDTLPQIELKLPKRPVRERLGAREETKKPTEVKEKEKEPVKRLESPERFTPEREPAFAPQSKSTKTRIEAPGSHKSSDSVERSDSGSRKLTSRVSVLESRPARSQCASVVRVRPRPRVAAPASSLLLRAVADAHKSLLNIPPKVDQEPSKIKRALVLPMRRAGDTNIVIQVPGDERASDNQSDNISLGVDIDSDDEKSAKANSDNEKDEYVPRPLTMKIKNTDYVPPRLKDGRTASRRDDSLVIETINIHNPTVDKDKNTQFIVTMDGFNPNAFLAKKLMTEGLLNEEDEVSNQPQETTSELKDKETKPKEKPAEKIVDKPSETLKKRLSNESEESETNVIIKQEEDLDIDKDKEKQDKVIEKRKSESSIDISEKPKPTKRRKASPIVFDVDKKEKEAVKERKRTESASSDNHVIVTTTTNSHKYDSVPPLSQAERKTVWCRAFPMCVYGSSCAFQHPRCKFAAACTRRGCPYSHGPAPPAPTVSSHVVPAANYKTISAVPLPSMCKYYPNCVNPGCPFYHPKPCRYGAACLNKLECNFYHADLPASKWRYPV